MVRPRANCTVERSCRPQYSGSVACAPVIQVPVTLDMNGTCGCCNRIRATPAEKLLTAGSTSAEWKPRFTGRRVQRTPTFAPALRSASIPSSLPATTICSGPLTAATDTPSGSSAETTSSDPPTAAIAPVGHCWIRSPRRAAS
ncbi:Uncharacterised protein [Mycobacteroides abscessus subsp. abscessus]|nr:Uncharacterised protein [Mycobacteroides abscessus subsp. abscessus]